MTDRSPVSFILGAPRSGTTLLRVMLAGHPRLFSPPEMLLAIFDTMREREAYLEKRYWEKGGLRRALMDLQGLDTEAAKQAVDAMRDLRIVDVYGRLSELAGGRIVIDKCPHLGLFPERMVKVREWFPNASFIYIVRHPGSVIRSIENMNMAEVMKDGMGVETAEEGWTRTNTNYREFLASVPAERKCTVKYEDLVTDARPVLERVCATLEIPFDEAVLDPYEGDRMREGTKGARAIGDPNLASRGKIQPELATEWLKGFDPRGVSNETRELARELGYVLEGLPIPPMAKAGDALRALLSTAAQLEAKTSLPMDIDSIEGKRFLMRMLSASVDTFVEHSDVDRPVFHHAEGPHRKMFADCPDTDYLRAPIRVDDGRAYRVWGRIPKGSTYAGVLLYGRGGRVAASLTDEQLKPDANGNFEVRVGKSPAGDGVWLRADGDENAVMVRQYFTDRKTEPPLEVNIEMLGDVPPPRPLDPAFFEKQIERAQRMLEAIFTRTLGAYNMAAGAALNRFVVIPGDQLFPTPDNVYQMCWYRIGRDQVMLLRGKKLPNARYYSLSLCNAWLETFDYTRHRVLLNHRQIRTADDGSFEICLAHRDVGHPNWLDTAGHLAGYVVVRNLLLQGEPSPIETQVLYESELAQHR